jgi:hypothetical protein
MIQQNSILEISQVGNGFIVRPAMGGWFENDRQRGVWVGASEDYLVFRTMAELQDWLANHFTHRARPNWPDVMPVKKTEAKPVKAA